MTAKANIMQPTPIRVALQTAVEMPTELADRHSTTVEGIGGVPPRRENRGRNPVGGLGQHFHPGGNPVCGLGRHFYPGSSIGRGLGHIGHGSCGMKTYVK